MTDGCFDYLGQEFAKQLDHFILCRMLSREDTATTEFSDEERAGLVIQQDRFYTHKTLRVNYGTYNLRRTYDTLNVRNADVMVLVDDDDGEEGGDRRHPYGYARILLIGHVFVKYNGPNQGRAGVFADGRFHRMDVLRVRWFGLDSSQEFGWKTRRLPRLSLLPPDEVESYGFLDPVDVIRGCHILPSFRRGKRQKLGKETTDYKSYLAGM